MKTSIKKTLLLASIFTIMASATQVFAAFDSIEKTPKGTTFQSFNVHVPGWNGSGTTGIQTKGTIGASAQIQSFRSGSYVNTDVRQNYSYVGASYHGPWLRNLNNNQSSYTVPTNANHPSGSDTKLEFSSDITTTAAYDVTGEWRSN